ncbi:biotin--[acetyl-CoA-carboxylase] ligase [Weeksella virosa]|uniref:biotin--[acetyl-CoA-carboxylase] ligase n=1 Tax=Weeksella virosa TaxID=1014 RepID=UPI002556783D|nr:biotin--[acetyl-CoA-carboxylase] ligase [Weeksella virosa]MDK7675900.1 biotin--[acetyl-CoA-carboxylase] ligase [Weeksella virosa]
MSYELHIFDTLPSTNSYLLDLTKKNAKDWVVIYAKDQTQGKGYAGSTWKTNAGENLTFSFSITTDLSYPELIFLNEWVANVLRDFLVPYLPQVWVKWPNDVIANDKKLVGVLIESFQRDQQMYTVVGVGLNVNQTRFESNHKASSLKLLTDRTYDLLALLADLMAGFQARFYQIQEKNFDDIHQTYQTYLYRKDVLSTFRAADKVFLGWIRKTDSDGKLWIELENNELKSFLHKEIELLYGE